MCCAEIITTLYYHSCFPIFFLYFLKIMPYYPVCIDTDLNETSLRWILEGYKIWSLLSDDYSLVGEIG